MRVLLLNPPFLKKFSRPQRSPAVTKSGTLYFPMWLAYAAGVLEVSGFEVDLIDAPADNYDLTYCVERAKEFGPGLIVIDTSTPSIYHDIGVAGRLKDELPETFIILVGTHVSALPDETLNIDNRVDAVAQYEYDYTLVELAKILDKPATGRINHGKTVMTDPASCRPTAGSGGSLNKANYGISCTQHQKRDLSEVAGIIYRDNHKFVHTPRRAFIENLDELPLVSKVYRKFLKVENYFNPNALYPMLTITTSRGCPFPCTFCVYPQTLMGRGFRLRSVENVVAELEYIIKHFPQVKAIFFEDDTLTVNKERCKALAELIIKRGIKISWTANSRVSLDYETMRIMKQAGCRSLCVGFESGSQQILDNMKKRIKIAEMESFMAHARRAGILIHGCFMAGLPGETKETLNQTLELAKRLNPDTVQFYPVMVYPGTEAYNWYKQKGLINADDFSKWITPEGLHNTVISTEALSSAELVSFCDDARRQFYLRPTYICYKLKQLLLHPQEIRRTLKAARTFIKYLIKGSDITDDKC